ncbi:aspartate aminotransferase family protein (plasmid) [Peteryoungia desertarenae]|uniref:Aspartate aminotransferase family protein n=1 Tax=Peteryoungia desertarenae TaxID=1813451 RepID=A0ABX6QTC2_9HYPH|nr:aspartate aminotransferase family protein [Peteryoungia desertarenae]QLF71729.1 aspartate aminotransferase family protein [Peteryoungia desertarenae]
MLQEQTSAAGIDDPLQSRTLYARARKSFPLGINRGTMELDPGPIYMASGQGAHITDLDGRRYLDLNNNFTTLLHGHAYLPVMEAVSKQLRQGTCFANPTAHEIALAELLIERIPAIEQLRFVNTDSEAVMFAIKAARAYTGRPAIARFAGAYHGSYDWAEIGQNVASDDRKDRLATAAPAYRGAPAHIADDVLVLEFNDIDRLELQLATLADRLAAILIDPMPSRAGLLEPQKPFIDLIHSLSRQHGILIIADEVLNLRQSYQGAASRYGLVPDLLTMGKIIGGGFPIGAIGGRSDVMAVFGKEGQPCQVSQGGTFSANPVSMVAGLVAMQAMTRSAFDRLERMGDRLRSQLAQCAGNRNLAFSITGAASLFRIHPRWVAPSRYAEAIPTKDGLTVMHAMTRFFRENGVCLPLGAAACLSTPMTDADIDHVVSVFDDFLKTPIARRQET